MITPPGSPTTDDALFVARQPIAWIASATDQLSRESGVIQTADLEDLVIITYLGLLDSPRRHDLTYAELLARCRVCLVA